MKYPEILSKLPPASFNSFYDLMGNPQKFNLLMIALEYGLFEHLKTPKTATRLARELKTDLRLTEKLCNALTAIDLLVKVGLCYCNSSLSNTYLVSSSPFFQGHLPSLKAQQLPGKWGLFAKALKEGPQKAEDQYADVYSSGFIEVVARIALRGRLQKTVNFLSGMPEFKNARTLLDVGGGHGLYAIAFAQANPKLEAYVLDFPQVINDSTKKLITDYGLSDRVHTISANFFEENLGSGYDVVFASDVLYRATVDQRLVVLQKIASSLNKGGIFATKHWFLNPAKTGPLNVVLFDIRLSADQYGDALFDVFTLGEFIGMLNDTGFVINDVIDIFDHADLSKLVVAKKLVN